MSDKVKEDYNKWIQYYERHDEKVPWNSGLPDSHLVRYISELKKSRGSNDWFPKSSIEIGCGYGATTLWLAAEGLSRCVGVDIAAVPIEKARASANIADVGGQCEFICADVMDYAKTASEGFDLVFDMQCWHCLRQVHEEAEAAQAVGRLMNPGGVLFSLCGNRNEPECGPPTLTATQLVRAFEELAGLRLLSLAETRFDNNPTYAKLPNPPLAWCALFKKDG